MSILDELKNWKGAVEINGTHYNSISEVENVDADSVTLLHRTTHRTRVVDLEYKVTVKNYMTQKSTDGFDFMSKWNNNVPMPLSTMTGTIERETRGMIYMKLHGTGSLSSALWEGWIIKSAIVDQEEV